MVDIDCHLRKKCSVKFKPVVTTKLDYRECYTEPLLNDSIKNPESNPKFYIDINGNVEIYDEQLAIKFINSRDYYCGDRTDDIATIKATFDLYRTDWMNYLSRIYFYLQIVFPSSTKDGGVMFFARDADTISNDMLYLGGEPDDWAFINNNICSCYDSISKNCILVHNPELAKKLLAHDHNMDKRYDQICDMIDRIFTKHIKKEEPKMAAVEVRIDFKFKGIEFTRDEYSNDMYPMAAFVSLNGGVEATTKVLDLIKNDSDMYRVVEKDEEVIVYALTKPLAFKMTDVAFCTFHARRDAVRAMIENVFNRKY